MASNKITALLFDFTQTLVNSSAGFKKAEKQAQDRIFKDLAMTDRDAFLDNYRRIRGEFHKKADPSRLAMFQEVYWHYCREADEERLRAWETDYWQAVRKGTEPFPETYATLRELSQRFRLGLVSNAEGRDRAGGHRVEEYPRIRKALSSIVIAGTSAVPLKPAPGAFHACLKELGVEARDAVHMGDDWEIDIVGAMNAGLGAVWLKHRQLRRHWPDGDARVPVATDLTQVGGMIDGGCVARRQGNE